MLPESLITRLESTRIVAVVTLENADDAVPVARALAAGGISAIELTLRTPAGLEAIRRIRAEVPEVVIGAGTVLNRGQVEAAKAAGAMFGVAPGCNPSTLRAAKEIGLPFGPGVATASDIEIALENGCRVLKFFPAETSGGLPHLTTLAAPFAHLGVRFIPLGGIKESTMSKYLESPLVLCVGGSWLVSADLVRNKDWNAIQQRAVTSTALARGVTGASKIRN